MNFYFAQVDIGFGAVSVEDFQAESLIQAIPMALEAAIRLTKERVGEKAVTDRIENEKEGFDISLRCWQTYGK